MAGNYTENYGLNQWERTDKVIMEEFNADNAKIDTALAVLRKDMDALDVVMPKIAVGSYTGDGTTTRLIEVGFTPRAVLVCSSAGRFYSPSLNNPIYVYGGLAVTGAPITISGLEVLSVQPNGFQVNAKTTTTSIATFYARTNASGTSYRYLAIG